jgi:hypothetical protein
MALQAEISQVATILTNNYISDFLHFAPDVVPIIKNDINRVLTKYVNKATEVRIDFRRLTCGEKDWDRVVFVTVPRMLLLHYRTTLIVSEYPIVPESVDFGPIVDDVVREFGYKSDVLQCLTRDLLMFVFNLVLDKICDANVVYGLLVGVMTAERKRSTVDRGRSADERGRSRTPLVAISPLPSLAMSPSRTSPQRSISPPKSTIPQKTCPSRPNLTRIVTESNLGYSIGPRSSSLSPKRVERDALSTILKRVVGNVFAGKGDYLLSAWMDLLLEVFGWMKGVVTFIELFGEVFSGVVKEYFDMYRGDAVLNVSRFRNMLNQVGLEDKAKETNRSEYFELWKSKIGGNQANRLLCFDNLDLNKLLLKKIIEEMIY